MSQSGKKFRNASAKVDRSKRYTLDEACKRIRAFRAVKA